MKKILLSSVIAASLFSGTALAVMDTLPASPQEQVTLMNMSFHPYNQWAFRNIGINPTVMVPRGGDITPIPKAPDPAIANLRFEHDGEEYTVNEAMTGDYTDGYIIIQDGKILHEAYFNGFTERDQHIWASSTKSLVAQSMGLLVEQGKIKPDAKVETYLPELKGRYFGNRTVREVLNMVSAIDYTEDYVDFTPGELGTEYFRRMGFIPAFDLMATDPTRSDTPRGVLELMPSFEGNNDLKPSHTFEYHSPNVDIVGWIVSRVSGMPLQTFIADHFWNKLGVEHDAVFMTDVAYTAVATGGFNSTLRDFARVGLAMVNNGSYNGQQVFSEAWVKDSFKLTDAEREHTARSVYKDINSPMYDRWLEGYKNYLWVHDSEKGVATFRGVYGQNLYINQEKDLVIATFSSANSPSNGARPTNGPRMAAFEAIADSIK